MTWFDKRSPYMTRRPRADDCDDDPETRASLPTIVVTEPDDDLTDTGLLDAGGDPIFRARSPIGFVPFDPFDKSSGGSG